MKKNTFFKALGPGLLWAGAAIGVSHLVQSTRAGASFGFELVWLVVIANVLKYPFFEFAPRYATATGENLIQGYRRIGKWAVILYTFITLSTMFILMAVIIVVTSGLCENIFKINLSTVQWSVILLLGMSIIILFRKYSTIDRIVKLIIVILAISVIVAVIAASMQGFNPDEAYSKHFSISHNIVFLLALAGWMPSAIDISVWHSVWTTAKAKETGYKPKLKEALLDFNIGYIGTGILALAFLSLGALVMYGKPAEFSEKGAVFSGQLIELFTQSLGSGAYYIIAPAALAAMFSTSLTCLDAYPRVLQPSMLLIINKKEEGDGSFKMHVFWLLLTVVGTIIVVRFFMSSMTKMVDFATIIFFLTAPIMGFLNLKAVTGKNMPQEARPKKWLLVLSVIGLLTLSFIGVYYIIVT